MWKRLLSDVYARLANGERLQACPLSGDFAVDAEVSEAIAKQISKNHRSF